MNATFQRLQVDERTLLHAIPIALATWLLVRLDSRLAFVWYEPEPWTVAGGLILLAVLGYRLPLALMIFVAVGLLTVYAGTTPRLSLGNFVWEVAVLGLGAALGTRVGLVVGCSALAWKGLQHFGAAGVHSSLIAYFYGAVSVALVVLLASELLRPRPIGSRGFDLSLRAFMIVGAGIASWVALAASSRAVWLGFAFAIVGTLVVIVAQRSRRSLILGGLWLASCAMTPLAMDAAFGSNVWSAVVQDVSPEAVEADLARPAQRSSIRRRFILWRQSIDLFLAYPLGSGTAGFGENASQLERLPDAATRSAHNIVFETMATGGIPRTLALAWVCVVVARGVRRRTPLFVVAMLAFAIPLMFDASSTYPKTLVLIAAFVVNAVKSGDDRELVGQPQSLGP